MTDFFSAKKVRTKTAPTDKPDAPARPPRAVPWVEKYRPKTVEDVAHQEEVVHVLQNTIKGNDFPNLLFYGPPGTGKTSTILACCRQLFGASIYKDRVLELNASDERGIQVVREKVKKFAGFSVSNKKPDGSPCPPFKIIILDEADSMTHSAQSALRRTMEKQTKTTRFCLICNYVSRIIEPITSRCAKFRFKPLSVDSVKERLQLIAAAETIDIEDAAIDEVIAASEGDMRKAITYLQSTFRLKAEEKINVQDIVEMAGVVPSTKIEDLVTVCHSGSFEKLDTCIKGMIQRGFSATQIVLQLHDVLVVHGSITDNQKAVIMEKLAVTDQCLCEGADEYLQLMATCTVIMDQVTKNG